MQSESCGFYPEPKWADQKEEVQLAASGEHWGSEEASLGTTGLTTL